MFLKWFFVVKKRFLLKIFEAWTLKLISSNFASMSGCFPLVTTMVGNYQLKYVFNCFDSNDRQKMWLSYFRLLEALNLVFGQVKFFFLKRKHYENRFDKHAEQSKFAHNLIQRSLSVSEHVDRNTFWGVANTCFIMILLYDKDRLFVVWQTLRIPVLEHQLFLKYPLIKMAHTAWYKH